MSISQEQLEAIQMITRDLDDGKISSKLYSAGVYIISKADETSVFNYKSVSAILDIKPRSLRYYIEQMILLGYVNKVRDKKFTYLTLQSGDKKLTKKLQKVDKKVTKTLQSCDNEKESNPEKPSENNASTDNSSYKSCDKNVAKKTEDRREKRDTPLSVPPRRSEKEGAKLAERELFRPNILNLFSHLNETIERMYGSAGRYLAFGPADGWKKDSKKLADILHDLCTTGLERFDLEYEGAFKPDQAERLIRCIIDTKARETNFFIQNGNRHLFCFGSFLRNGNIKRNIAKAFSEYSDMCEPSTERTTRGYLEL